MAGEVTISEENGIGLVGVEEVDAAQVGSQRAETMQVEVLLNADVAYNAWLGDAEIIVFALRSPF